MILNRRELIGGAAALGLLGSVEAMAGGPRPQSAIFDAIVLGAGASGLNAAWLLEQQGLRVLVLEGRDRVGGRILTLRDQPGHPEMGFNTMYAGYGLGLDAAQRAGVELIDIGPRYEKHRDIQVIVDGESFVRESWTQSPKNPLPPQYRSLFPHEAVNALFSKNNRLADWTAWNALENTALDISVHDFLAAQGLSDPAIRLVFDTSPYYGTNAWDMAALTYEFADGWNKSQFADSRASYAVKGGNYRLAEGMRALLKADVLLGKEVTAISDETDAATVICRDGTRYRARRIVCSLPFSTLRNVRIDPGFSGPQAQAVTSISYQAISLGFLTVREPFWEKDGLPASIWSDGPLGNVMAQRFGATDNEVTGLTVYGRSELANYWDRLGKDAALALMVSELEKARPAAKGQVTGAAYHSWAQEQYSAGDWAYFAPGQITAFSRQMIKPAGRIHFCGEHTALVNRGLEGALESSQRATLEVLSL